MILPKLSTDFIIILVGKLLQIIVMILSIRMMTNLLDSKEMGHIYIFTTIYTFFVLTLVSPVGLYINRHTHKWYKEEAILDNLGTYLIYLLVISIISVCIGTFIYSYGILNNMSLNIFLSLLFCFVLVLTLNQTILPMLNMLRYRLAFTSLTILTSLGIILFGYLSVSLLGYDADNWLIGIISSNVIFLFIGFIILKSKLYDEFQGFKYNLEKISKKKIKSILKFLIPLSIATLFMWLQNSGYRILIERNIGLEFLGFLGVGMAISTQIASVFESIIMQYFHPLYYEEITNSDLNTRKIAIESLISRALPIYFMLALFLTFLSKSIIEILVDIKFHEAYIYMVFGVWVEFFRMTTNLFGNISQSEMNTRNYMVPYIVGSLVTIALVYFGSVSPQYEIYIPLSLVCGGFLTMMVMYINMQKLIGFSINFKLLLLTLFVSLPYLSVYFIHVKTNIYINLFIVISFGLYFLGTIFFIYTRGEDYVDS